MERPGAFGHSGAGSVSRPRPGPAARSVTRPRSGSSARPTAAEPSRPTSAESARPGPGTPDSSLSEPAAAARAATR